MDFIISVRFLLLDICDTPRFADAIKRSNFSIPNVLRWVALIELASFEASISFVKFCTKKAENLQVKSDFVSIFGFYETSDLRKIARNNIRELIRTTLPIHELWAENSQIYHVF